MLDPAQQQMLDRGLEVSSVAGKKPAPARCGRADVRNACPPPSRAPRNRNSDWPIWPCTPVTLRPPTPCSPKPAAWQRCRPSKPRPCSAPGGPVWDAEDLATAKTHFLAAAELATGTSVAPWVMNGLAVVAALEGDYPLAEQHYKAALAVAAHPLITANLLRTLVESGRLDAARQTPRQP